MIIGQSYSWHVTDPSVTDIWLVMAIGLLVGLFGLNARHCNRCV